MQKFVYSFNEGSKDMIHLLGDKGASLAEMTKIGLPVPFGFTITTEACRRFFEERETLDDLVILEIHRKIEELESVTGRVFGCSENPLLVSVRAGDEDSMPGMLGSILNLGLNDEIVESMAAKTGNECFAYDCYRRFLQMYGITVFGIPSIAFSLPKTKKWYGKNPDYTVSDLKDVIKRYKGVIYQYTSSEVPEDVFEQLTESVKALFRSCSSKKALLYKRINGIPDSIETAVTVQAMVFGNSGENSGTGVAFTRSPLNGENKVFGEFLTNSQGEDIVKGYRTPRPLSDMEEVFPDLCREIIHVSDVLEKHYKEVQDIEFTIENGKLYMLQSRTAKQTASSTVKTAFDMVEEGYIDKETAILRINPKDIHQILHPSFDAEAEKKAEVLGTGLPSSPGAATGRICFNSADAKIAADAGEKVILVRQDTSPSDFSGMLVSEGILTVRGGTTSYAAMVARGMGKCCVSGCPDLVVNETEKYLTFGNEIFHEGDKISLNGSKGLVYRGEIRTVLPKFSKEFNAIMSWADEVRNLKVRANVDNAEEAELAVFFGAEGIGLYRTEHMFFNKEHLDIVRDILVAKTDEEKNKALKKFLPYQKEEFKKAYEIMEDKPMTIRLLDYSMYEFFLQGAEDMEDLADFLDIPYSELKQMADEYYESNAMLGHRGCRLAITYSEIAKMQARAIVEAAHEVSEEKHIDITPEIIVPLVGISEELKYVKQTMKDAIEEYLKEQEINMDYSVGVLIEVPRAALVADQLAQDAEFFSFGTNDMTQMVYGFSRNDTGDLVKEYIDKGIFKYDPFQVIDEDGIGALMKFAIRKGRQTRPGLKLGICGEHGGNPESIDFCHRIGLNYVSCSPYRVPVARVAAAQAAIREKKKNK